MYHSGLGIPRDYARAQALYEQAAALGYKKAEKNLKRLLKKIGDSQSSVPIDRLSDVDKGVVIQFFHDITGYGCNAISGTEDSLVIEAVSGHDKASDLIGLLLRAGATVSVKTQTASKQVINITGISHEKVVELIREKSETNHSPKDESAIAASSGSTPSIKEVPVVTVEAIEVVTSSYEKRLKDIRFNMNKIPDDFKCPLSLSIMDNPVLLGDFKTYDEASLKAVIQPEEETLVSPLTREVVSKDYIANSKLKNRIEAFVVRCEKEHREELEKKKTDEKKVRKKQQLCRLHRPSRLIQACKRRHLV